MLILGKAELGAVKVRGTLSPLTGLSWKVGTSSSLWGGGGGAKNIPLSFIHCVWRARLGQAGLGWAGPFRAAIRAAPFWQHSQ